MAPAAIEAAFHRQRFAYRYRLVYKLKSVSARCGKQRGFGWLWGSHGLDHTSAPCYSSRAGRLAFLVWGFRVLPRPAGSQLSQSRIFGAGIGHKSDRVALAGLVELL